MVRLARAINLPLSAHVEYGALDGDVDRPSVVSTKPAQLLACDGRVLGRIELYGFFGLKGHRMVDVDDGGITV